MELFSQALENYRSQVDQDIAAYVAHANDAAEAQFGADGRLVSEAFFDLLTRGGKRMRGSLVMTGYQMCGGSDMRMIVRAATAIEMIQAALLIMDDIQDRSAVRRGKPTVHKLLESRSMDLGLDGDAAHIGVSLALNAMIAGQHAALMLVNGLNVDAELRTKALSIISHCFAVTTQGQTVDILNECRSVVSEAAIDKVMEWKTAYYSVLNPLCVGMVLAGAGCADTDAIRDYALHAGKAFQISDDITGVFGEESETGKNPIDDIREGKKTLLTVFALAHATPEDEIFLRKQLGNADLQEGDFIRCRRILERSGARQYATKRATMHARQALAALDDAPVHWKSDHIAFLRDLVRAIQDRAA